MDCRLFSDVLEEIKNPIGDQVPISNNKERVRMKAKPNYVFLKKHCMCLCPNFLPNKIDTITYLCSFCAAFLFRESVVPDTSDGNYELMAFEEFTENNQWSSFNIYKYRNLLPPCANCRKQFDSHEIKEGYILQFERKEEDI